MKLLTFILISITGATHAAQIQVTSTPHGTQFRVNHQGNVVAVTANHVATAAKQCGKHEETWIPVAGRDIAWRSVLDQSCTARSGAPPELGDFCTVVTRSASRIGTVIDVDVDGFLLDCKLCKGESGSPVLNSEGEVVGVAVAHGCPGNVCGRPSFHEAFTLEDKRRPRAKHAKPSKARPPRSLRLLPKRAQRNLGRAHRQTNRRGRR